MAIVPSRPHPANSSRNYYAFFGDYIGFSLAMAFASSTTILPDLVGRLTSNELAVGLLATVTNGSWLLPQLIYANWLTNKRRKKPYYLLASAVGRPLYLLYGIALVLGLHRQPLAALLALYGVQAIFFGTDALATVAWFDVLGKAVPETRRGRLIGRAQLIGGLGSAGAGVLVAYLFGADGLPYPQSFAVVLGLSSVCLFLGTFVWNFVVEPDEAVEETRPRWRDYFAQLSRILREDRAFARLILVRLLAGLDGLATSFYVIFATRELGLPSTAVGLFTTAQIVGKVVASAGMGALAERSGSHRVIQAATAVALTAPLASLVLLLTGVQGSLAAGAVFAWVFAVLGTTISAGMLGYMNYVMALSPTGQRPNYIGLTNTISGVLIVVPTLGGWLLQTTSYAVLFALTAGMLILAHLLSWGLPAAIGTQAPQEAASEALRP